MENVIADPIRARHAEYLKNDGRLRQQQYEALPPEQQASVDAILNTAVL